MGKVPDQPARPWVTCPLPSALHAPAAPTSSSFLNALCSLKALTQAIASACAPLPTPCTSASTPGPSPRSASTSPERQQHCCRDQLDYMQRTQPSPWGRARRAVVSGEGTVRDRSGGNGAHGPSSPCPGKREPRKFGKGCKLDQMYYHINCSTYQNVFLAP